MRKEAQQIRLARRRGELGALQYARAVARLRWSAPNQSQNAFATNAGLPASTVSDCIAVAQAFTPEAIQAMGCDRDAVAGLPQEVLVTLARRCTGENRNQALLSVLAGTHAPSATLRTYFDNTSPNPRPRLRIARPGGGIRVHLEAPADLSVADLAILKEIETRLRNVFDPWRVDLRRAADLPSDVDADALRLSAAVARLQESITALQRAGAGRTSHATADDGAIVGELREISNRLDAMLAELHTKKRSPSSKKRRSRRKKGMFSRLIARFSER